MLGISYGTSSNASLLGNFEIVATTVITPPRSFQRGGFPITMGSHHTYNPFEPSAFLRGGLTA